MTRTADAAFSAEVMLSRNCARGGDRASAACATGSNKARKQGALSANAGPVQGARKGRQLRTRNVHTARAKTTHSQAAQHRRPTLGRDFAGRNRQPFAAPRAMTDAGGWLVVKAHVSELDVMYHAGDDVTHAGHADMVALLPKPCLPPRMYGDKKHSKIGKDTKNSSYKPKRLQTAILSQS
jgi:hypothetical protein